MSVPREDYIPVENGELYYRVIGQGQPIIVLHGGPDFDHTYLLPDMDRLSDSYRLIYYDQRGRGKSAGRAEDISIKSELEDLEALRKHFELDSMAVLGHSWGGTLAMLYALAHPDRVSHLILMNTSVASHEDHVLGVLERQSRLAAHDNELTPLKSSAKFAAGDVETVSKVYQIYFSATFSHRENQKRLDMSLRNFTDEGILRARAIEDRLYGETLLSSEFNLIPKLKGLSNPTLLIHGDYDFVPIETVTPIAEAIPGARMVVLKDCGHFSYIESPDEVRQAIDEFFDGA